MDEITEECLGQTADEMTRQIVLFMLSTLKCISERFGNETSKGGRLCEECKRSDLRFTK